MTGKPVDCSFEIEVPVYGDIHSSSSHTWTCAIREEIVYAGQVFRFSKPLTVEAHALWSESDLSVSLKVSSTVTTPCSRCLEPTDIEISSDFMYRYTLQGKRPSSEDDSEERDHRLVPVSAWRSHLDVSDQVWETLMLSLPLRVLCSSECRGLCHVCGRPLADGPCGCPTADGDLKLADLFPEAHEEIADDAVENEKRERRGR
ncbi:MAG TPA: hypothetical protein DIC53_05505 [Synergistaceae bacterium]|jgi:uncharacterized protein|nr:hypothetical protein [Synergistaceae bacterium]